MNITFFGVKDSERGYLEANIKKTFPDAEVDLFDVCLDIESIAKGTSAEVISIFTSCKATKEVISKFPNLKLIVCRSTGYDNVDIDECKKRGITVCNVPSYGEHTVAEFTFALLLAVSRKIIVSEKRVRETKSFSKEGLTGFDLYGKTLGVVGTGRIGQHVIKIAKGFEMNVIAFDAFPKPDLQIKLGFSYTTFDEVLKNSDILTLHVPALNETTHMINADALEKMKVGAYIINTSRGSVVDTRALISALMSGHIAGAGLDVLEDEKEINQELLSMPNVLITPHNAFDTKEALERILATTLENIASYISAAPQNTVGQQPQPPRLSWSSKRKIPFS